MLLSKTEKLIMAMVLVLLLIGMGLSYYDHALFRESYVREDGFIEWLTVLGLLMCAGVCAYRVATLWRHKSALFTATLAFVTLVFIFGAGEEISWGQRILNVETSEFFEQHAPDSPTRRSAPSPASCRARRRSARRPGRRGSGR